jgi:DNA-binding IclR family transcriptional regulator
MTAVELASSIRVHKTSAYRYLNTLLNAGYIRNNGDGHYHLGNKILELGSQLLRRMPLRETAHPFLVELSADIQKTVHLCVLDGYDVVYIDKIESHRTLPIMSRIGSRAPAYCTGIGKALLSGLSTDQVVSLLREVTLEKRTSNTITDPIKLLEEIKITAERGYAIDNGEHEVGIKCFAAPVRGYGGDIVGAVSLTGLKRNFDDPKETEVMIAAVKKTAAEISRALGSMGKESSPKVNDMH